MSGVLEEDRATAEKVAEGCIGRVRKVRNGQKSRLAVALPGFLGFLGFEAGFMLKTGWALGCFSATVHF